MVIDDPSFQFAANRLEEKCHATWMGGEEENIEILQEASATGLMTCTPPTEAMPP